jgi:hypothetical protein
MEKIARTTRGKRGQGICDSLQRDYEVNMNMRCKDKGEDRGDRGNKRD